MLCSESADSAVSLQGLPMTFWPSRQHKPTLACVKEIVTVTRVHLFDRVEEGAGEDQLGLLQSVLCEGSSHPLQWGK